MRIDLNISGLAVVSMLLISVFIGSETIRADAPADLTMTDLTNWLDAYGAAWESRDSDKAASLFTEDSSYQVTPYEEPHIGQDGIRRYWEGVTANQRNVRFEHRPLSVEGNTGIAHWSAQFDVEPGATHIELDGIFVLEFDEHGKCRKLREWWHLRSQQAESEK